MPVLVGIEEIDPDGSVTRRLLHLDGRERALVYHRGTLPEPPASDQGPSLGSAIGKRASLV